MSNFNAAVLKVTGDAFTVDSSPEVISELAEEIVSLRGQLSGGLVVCVGGGAGNRGRDSGVTGTARLRVDMQGMLASCRNASLLAQKIGNDAIGFSAVPYNSRRHDVEKSEHGLRLQFEDEVHVLEAMEVSKRGVVVAGGGIGRGLVSTDLGAALWAADLAQMGHHTALLKGSNVDGVFDDDPNKNPNAKRLDRLSYDDASRNGLSVVDLAAWPILKDAGVTTVIYKNTPGNMAKAVAGEIGSRVDVDGMRMTA